MGLHHLCVAALCNAAFPFPKSGFTADTSPKFSASSERGRHALTQRSRYRPGPDPSQLPHRAGPGAGWAVRAGRAGGGPLPWLPQAGAAPRASGGGGAERTSHFAGGKQCDTACRALPCNKHPSPLRTQKKRARE